MAHYTVRIDLSESTGRTYEGRYTDAYRFKKEKVDLDMSESFIPAIGEHVIFKHEGRWWRSRVADKTTAIVPDPTSPKYARTFDFLITLTLDTCLEEQVEPTF